MAMTDEQRKFLRLLEASGSIPVPRSKLALVADRAQDRARQSCKRDGLAEFVGGIIDGKHRPMGWRLTAKGRAALTPPR